ncbi:MAG TPA: hypothetical protein VLD18_10425, partial [Verrucomicrobiae bacterium]|nr:hypothetical protein [Verrucomicrobiae bacterium]
GSQLIKVDAASLNGVKAAGFWQLGGNGGTTAGVDFIGTTDAQPLDLRVGGARGLRIEPTTNSSTVNIVAGSTGNFVGASAVGVTIAGGGSESLDGFVGTNSVAASFGSIGGGFNNHINVGADFAGIAGGAHNELQSKAFISTISGGRLNVVGSDAQFGVIAGGSNNRVGAGAVAGVIGGGVQNLVDDGAVHATVGGGNLNTIGDSSITSTIGGGFNNLVQTGVSSATIAGGRNNIVGPGSDNTTISGGVSNVVNLSAIGATIGGGANNTVIAVAQYGTVPGGEQNTAGGKWSFAAGRRANAGADGSFVWGDSTDETVFAPDADTFTVRASNGVHLTKDAGSAKAVSVGERYRDNAVVAWARITSTGTVNGDFGIASVVRNGVGSYTVNTTAAAQFGTTLIPMAVAEVDTQPTSASTVRLVSVNQKTTTSFDVYVNNGSFAPVDNDFLFMVTGR